jgi:hypothetical protein
MPPLPAAYLPWDEVDDTPFDFTYTTGMSPAALIVAGVRPS